MLRAGFLAIALSCDGMAQAQTYKPDWHRVEADNGAVMVIDMKSIRRGAAGGAQAVVCLADNDRCSPMDASRWAFDCHGHFQDIDRHSGALQAPPRSVAGAIAALACAGVKDVR